MSDGGKASEFHHLIPFGEIKVLATQLVHFEVRNTLLRLMRSKQLSPEQFAECLANFEAMKMRTDMHPGLRWAIQLARKHNLTYYDAIYLELAMTVAKSHSVILATFDKALVKAAQAEGIPLLYQRN